MEFLKNRFLRVFFKIKKNIDATEWDMSDVFLVSYPKSGVTFLSLVLANILSSKDNVKRRIDFFNVHDYIPDIHSNPQRIKYLDPPRIIKTHEDFNEWHKRIKIKGHDIIFPRVIYLIRDGKDAMASYYDYFCNLTGKDIRFNDFLKWKTKKRVNWDIHVKGWILNNNVIDSREILIIRYEDLLSNEIHEVKKIMDFLGIRVSEAIIEDSIEKSSLRTIGKFEAKFGGGTRYKNSQYTFARKGEKRVYDKDLKEKIRQYYNNNIKTFNELGY